MQAAADFQLSQGIFAYWQHAAHRAQLNRVNFQLSDIRHLHSTQSAAVIAGQLDSTCLQNLKLTADAKTVVWVATKVAQQTETGAYLAPYWLPAILSATGQLTPLPALAYPFVPTALIDPAVDTLLLGQLPNWDEAWASHFENQAVTTWEALLASTAAMMQAMAGNTWEKRITEQGYTWVEEALLVLPPARPAEDTGLMPVYLSLEDIEYQENLSVRAQADYFQYYVSCVEAGQTLPAEEMKVLFHLLALPENQCQAVLSPPGTQKSTLLKDLIAAVWLKAAMHSEAPPKIVQVGGESVEDYFTFGAESEGLQSVSNAQQALQQQHEILVSGLSLVQRCCHGEQEAPAQNTEVLTLQTQDSALEDKANVLNQQLATWRQATKPQGWLKRCWSSMTGGKAKALAKARAFHSAHLTDYFAMQEETPLAEQIVQALRKIKVARTKLHNQLMLVTEALTQKQGDHQQLVHWFENQWDHVPDIDTFSAVELSKMLCEQMHESIFDLLTDYWRAQAVTQAYQYYETPCAVKDEAAIDWLIVMHSEARFVPEWLPLMAKAKRMIVLGDMAQQCRLPSVPRRIDDHELLTFGLASEPEALEDLQFRGMTALSSLFELAQEKSYFKRMPPHGLLAQNELKLTHLPLHRPGTLAYANTHIYNQQLIPGCPDDSELPAMQYYHARYASVEAVHAWLSQTAYPSRDIGIITLTGAAKQALIKPLAKTQVTIKTVAECEDFRKPVILFLPGMTLHDPKPYPFDQGEQRLNKVTLCAQSQFILWGDMSIWDPKMHSPSGNLAKSLFKMTPYPLCFDHMADYTGAEAHQRLWQTATEKVQRALTVVSEGLEAKSVEALAMLTNLTSLQSRGINVTFYVGTKGLMGVGPQAKRYKQQLQYFAEHGVTVYLVRNLHSNALWWDDEPMVEGQFPWLAGFGKLKSHRFGSVTGDKKRKISFQSYLSLHGVRALKPSKVV